MIGTLPFNELREILKSKVLVIPVGTEGTNLSEDWETNVHVLFSKVRGSFAVGITNSGYMTAIEKILFFQVAPYLMKYGLIEKVKLTGGNYNKMQTSKDGMRYLKYMDMEKREKNASQVVATSQGISSFSDKVSEPSSQICNTP